MESRHITGREQTELPLRDFEILYRSLVEQLPQFILCKDLAGRFTFANTRFCQFLRRSLKDVVGKTDYDLYPRELAEQYRADDNWVVSTDAVLEKVERHRSPEGQELYVHLLKSPLHGADGQVIGVQGIFWDVTARHQAEEALRRSEAHLAAAQRIAHVGSWQTELRDLEDLSHNPLWWSDEVYRIFGYEPGSVSVTRELFANAVAPADRTAVAAAVEAALRQRQPYEIEHGIVLPDGSERTVHEHAEVECDLATGLPTRLVGTVQDVTERKRAELAIRDQERFISAVARNSPDLIVVFDLQKLRYVYSNKRWHEVLGYSEEEAKSLRSRDWRELFHPEDAARLREHFAQLAQAADGDIQSFEFRLQRRSGEYAWFIARDVVFQRDSTGRVTQVLSVIQDITEQKQAEETRLRLESALRQAHKMKAVGQLAGGVAHDFNNLLTVILGNAGLLERKRELTGDARECLHQIVGAAERAANLTRQLLAYSRQQVMQVHPLDLNDVLRRTTHMLGRLIGEHISVQCHFASDLPRVSADAGMIEEVVVNLAVNARDAMPNGGLLTVSTQHQALTAEQVHHADARPGRFVSFAVADTGCGMDPATCSRLFEPFFTTKDVGKGTGLGLATVYGIVRQHNGWVEVASQVGEGSTFTVFLPVGSAEPTSREPDTSPRPVPSHRGCETILVVEDEAPLRELLRACLEDYGYRVLVAADGMEALRVWESAHGMVDLLLTDLVMPGGMSGRELADRLRSFRQRLKVILSSGYSRKVIETGDAPPDHAYLPKPYNPATLAQTVRHCLDAC